MVCQNCDECEYPNQWGCYDRDYDCESGNCFECQETDECKYETGEMGAIIYAFQRLVDEGKVNRHPMIRGD